MKTFSTLFCIFLGFTSIKSAPAPHHLAPGTQSTYHGILGTFDVSPDSHFGHIAPVTRILPYSPFAQTVLPQIPQVPHFGYRVHYQVAAPAINYYTPSYSFLEGVPIFGASFASPVADQTEGVETVAAFPTVPTGVSGATSETESEIPDNIATESQTQVPTLTPIQAPGTDSQQNQQNQQNEQNQPKPQEEPQYDSVIEDDDDTVTVDAI